MSAEDLNVSAYVDGGRFALRDSAYDGEIINRMGARWLIDKQINEEWSVLANIHWLFWRNQATDRGLFHIAGQKFDSDLQGAITYHPGSQRVKFGLYEFKYNPDSKNLGEYLLRSEAYPTIIEGSQGKDLLAYSYSRVAGVEHGLNYRLFRGTAIVYAEQFNMPVNDISAAYIAEAGPETAELGLGVSYHRFLSLGSKINNSVLDAGLRDYVKKNGLETRAWKFMARGSLDLAAMTGLQPNWGVPPSFKLYFEAALLGTKKDTLYYKDVMQRLPIMAGIDIPTFGILNTLSFEGEYFKNPYLGRKYLREDASGNNFSPLPYLDDYSNLPKNTKDDFKWSVYAHRALNSWLDVKLRFASDHLRLLNWNGDYEGGEPMTRSGKDWYFLARIEYHN